MLLSAIDPRRLATVVRRQAAFAVDYLRLPSVAIS
jgi:hypothetical protein